MREDRGSSAGENIGGVMTEEQNTASFDESLCIVNMLLDMDADRIADQDEDEQDPQEKENLLHFREVVRRVESQAKQIESLQHDLDLYRDALQSVVTNELPPGHPDPIDPSEFVTMCVTHMDHEGYRDAVRVAAALIGMKRLYE